MATQALFYEEVVAVSSERHADWCIDGGAGVGFAARSNFVPLATVEFEKAVWHYPVVFLSQSDRTIPVTVLGLEEGQNLFVENDRPWLCEYVPAYVRRYPFIIASGDSSDTFTLCLDEAYVGCNQADNGERLFLLGGGRSAFLERTLAFVQRYHTEFTRSAEFCTRLTDLGLLEPMQAQVALRSGDKFALTGFQTVSRERLQALSGDTLSELATVGHLELIYLHLFSLANFGALMDRHARRRPEAQPDANE